MHIQFTDRSLGAFVTGLELTGLDEQSFHRLRDLVHQRGVVAVRGLHLSQGDQVRFARRFGALQKIFIKEALSAEFDELFFVSNVVENGKPLGSMDAGRFWHTDGAYLQAPHSLSMLYAVEVPHEGERPLGDTDFTDMAAAYDALDLSMRQRIEGLRAIHSLHQRYGVKTENAEDMARRSLAFDAVTHPLAIRHPDTGRRCLYLSEGYTAGIEGWSDADAAPLLQALCEHVVQPRFRYRHVWAEGDLLIWDNRSTLHRANFDYGPHQRRVMRRATVAGQPLG